MSNLSGFVKDGWHPKGKDGGKESWRGDFKGINQVAGWMGKGKDTNSDSGTSTSDKVSGWMGRGKDTSTGTGTGTSTTDRVAGLLGRGKDTSTSTYNRSEHVSQPLSSLKDPASFGPPPKHVKYPVAAAPSNDNPPDLPGRGAPLSQGQADQNTQQQAEVEEEEPARPTPPVPYRADRTGLSTSNLPPPPVRRTDSTADSRTPRTSRPKPNVPPRMPPRQPAPPQSPSPPPAYAAEPPSGHSSEGYLNERATSNLSREGVSVPALGIDGNGGSAGSANAPSLPARGPARQSSVPNAPSRGDNSSMSSIGSFRERHNDQIQAGKQKISGVNEKYGISRRVNSFIEDQRSPAGNGGSTGSASSTGNAPTPPARGPARQSSIPNAPSRGDNSSMSSINSFRERHNDQIQGGKQKISGVNEKYGISRRVNSFIEDQRSPAGRQPPPPPPSNQTSPNTDVGARKKAPPPPPPKKQEIRASPVGTGPAPPPVPLGTKPR